MTEPSFCIQRQIVYKCKTWPFWAVGALTSFFPLLNLLTCPGNTFTLCLLLESRWTSTDRSTGSLYSLQMAQQCYRYILPRVPAHVLGLLRSIHVPASLWYYLQGSIIKNFNRAIALKVWVSSECEGLASMQGGYASLGSMPLVQTIP